MRQVVQHIEEGDAAAAAKVWRRDLVFYRDEMIGRSAGPAATPTHRTNDELT